MTEGHKKRKEGPDGSQNGRFKKNRGANTGAWKTPHQKKKEAARIEMGTALDIGHQGIWVTYARGMKTKAVKEFTELCENYGKEMYGLKLPEEDEETGGTEQQETDIADSIEAELKSLKTAAKPKAHRHFAPIASNIDCVFFMKTREPVEPEKLVLKICEDARECQDAMKRKCKYINRLTPVLDMDKATEAGIEKVTRSVLGSHFDLRESQDEHEEKAPENEGSKGPTSKGEEKVSSYAIRHNVRSHQNFKSSEIIQMVAAQVDPKHKVDLTTPDKVVLVEVFQSFCGLSVVDGKQWEEMKRYNVSEMYKLAFEDRVATENGHAGTKTAEN